MNFEFEFNVEKPENTNTGDDNRPSVDWAARTKYMVDKCGTGTKAETEIFIVTGVIDLGMQMQEDGKSEFKGDESAQKAELEKNPDQYFEVLKNDKGVDTLYKRWKITKPQQSVALMVDNPNRMLDIQQFHDAESDGTLHPYRMLLNGEFYSKAHGKKIVNKMGYSTKEVKNADGSWSFKNNTTLYKLGKAADVLVDDKFKPAQIGKLIGKAILCEFQVAVNKVGDKEYLNEKIGFRGEVPSFMKSAIPAIDPKYFFGVNFKGEQNLEVLKHLRQSVIVTMQNATNFKGSDIEKALIQIGRVKASTEEEQKQDAPIEPKVSTPAPKQQAPQPTPDFDSFDDDIPF